MLNSKVIIVGATSGIGYELAKLYIQQGYVVGIAGRRIELLNKLKQLQPNRVFVQALDVNADNAEQLLAALIAKLGGLDLYIHVSGIGSQNISLSAKTELDTIHTNTFGFTRMIISVFHYFATQQYGHIAVITSIAGTKGLGSAPAYSATKRFQRHYIQCLAQLAGIRKLPIHFTEIRPGFVNTDFLKESYPMMIQPEQVATATYKAICHNKRTKTIDWRFALLVRIWELIPNSIWERIRITNKQ